MESKVVVVTVQPALVAVFSTSVATMPPLKNTLEMCSSSTQVSDSEWMCVHNVHVHVCVVIYRC